MSKYFLKGVALPLLFLTVLVALYFFWKILDLPPEDEFIQIIKGYFERYGLLTVLTSALLEGMLFIGWYFPGSLVIFLGVIFAGKDFLRVSEVLSVATVGLSSAYLLNFFLGKYGWYRLLLSFSLSGPLEDAQRRLTKYGLSTIFLSYWQPNLAALTSTAAGILQFSFRKFFIYSLGATILWNIFWGALVYILGEASLYLVGLRFVIITIVVWAVFKWRPKKIVAGN